VDSGNGFWSPYGRVIRCVGDYEVEIVDVTRHVQIYDVADVMIVHNYKGMWQNPHSDLRQAYPVWIPMPSLRKLKQMASGYNPQVFKKNRKRLAKQKSEE
jgi:hypothetical protein